MTCPQSVGSAISIVPQGTAELQRQISSLRDSHPSFHSFIFLYLHKQGYVMEERNIHSLCLLNLSNQAHQETTLPQPQSDPLHSFPSQSTLNKTWPEKTVLHGRIPVQQQISLPNCRKKLPQDGPICSHVRKLKGKCRAQGDLDYDC